MDNPCARIAERRRALAAYLVLALVTVGILFSAGDHVRATLAPETSPLPAPRPEARQ